MRIINWIRSHKLATVLLAIIFLFIGDQLLTSSYRSESLSVSRAPVEDVYYDEGYEDYGAMEKMAAPAAGMPIPQMDSAPNADVEERLVIEESSMSLVVKDVSESTDAVTTHAESVGGYMVSSSLEDPEEDAFAKVVLRVPEDQFRASLDFFRSLAIKVTSEKLTGRDVTDEYVDIEARLETLNKTKVKFEEILEKAVKVQDILDVQQRLIHLQSQIDSLKGQQKYLEQNAALAKITVYLSTDELALPYTPSERFRPDVIFKTAVRSLLQKLQDLAGLAIWVGVYAVIWVPLVVFIILFRRWRKKRKQSS